MRHTRTLSLLVAAFSVACSLVRTGSGQTGLVASQLVVPEKYRAIFDSDRTVLLPPGFECSVYYAQPQWWAPRFMAVDEYGVLAVADAGNSQVIALPDRDSNGVADSAILFATEDSNAHSIAFGHAALYAASARTVFQYLLGFDRVYHNRTAVTQGIGADAEGSPNHTSRTILFGPVGDEQWFYLSVGAPCNACRESDTTRATIQKYFLSGGKR